MTHPLELNHADLTRADIEAARVHTDPAPPPPPAPSNGTTYTHGVPEAVVRDMTAEQQILAQTPGPHKAG